MQVITITSARYHHLIIQHVQVHTCKKSMTDEELFVDIVDGTILLQDNDVKTYEYIDQTNDPNVKPLSATKSKKLRKLKLIREI